MRTCEVDTCVNVVWGTDRLTRTGYCKFHQHLRTDVSKESILQRAQKKQRQNAAGKTGTKLRGLAYDSDSNREMVKAYKSKSELLKEADRLFADYIKRRDVKNGACYCPCCNKVFDSNGVEINCMHFCDRDIYSLRFDEDNAHAGHGWCNKKQHDNPKGIEYQNFKTFLVDKLGEEEVKIMELEHRKINKITEQQLKVVIEHYGQS